MEPKEIAYDICRYYLFDLQEVDPALVAKIGGFHRSRNLAELTSCSRHFDLAKHTIKEWRFTRQIEAFFKKNANLSHKDTCFEAARISFLRNEEVCSETNVRLKKFIDSPHLLDEGIYKKILRMKQFISKVLGDYHSFIDDLPYLVRVTPGATSNSSRVNSLPQLKMRLKLYATHNASKYLRALYHFYGFEPPRIKTVHSNRVELVPKNWKTDRTIACEPEGNLPLQLAFDKYAKRRLRRFGIDLSDQSANRRLAKHASINDDLVTVDFSAASDTISFNTVSWLLPVDWFKYLFDVRTPGYRGVFGRGVFAKFSSMGNGATFALETLIFAAACYAVNSKRFSVYGDDVILEKELYQEYIELTRFLGFTINQEKSFHEGPFRESCGLDSFNGVDVTPTFIRGIDKRKASLCHLINTVGSLAIPGGKLEAFLLDLQKSNKLPLVPFQESTLSGVWICPDRARQLGLLRRKHGIDTFKSYVAKSKKRKFVDIRGYYLWFLYKNSQVLFGGPWEMSAIHEDSTQTSSVRVFDHGYVRKRVCWHLPAVATPVHLYWWTDLLAPR